MRLRIDLAGPGARRFLSALRIAAGPAAGCAVGFLAGGLFGALSGALIGSLLGELLRRSVFPGGLPAYLRDPGKRSGAPPVDEPFPGACLLSGFAVSFEPESAIGFRSAEPAAPSGFERVALARIALEAGSGLSRSQSVSFTRLAQGLLPQASSFPSRRLLTAYFSAREADPLIGALCAWGLFRGRWPEPGREERRAMREYLSGSGCPSAACRESERLLFPARAEDWELLGLRPGAGIDEIKKSFRALSLAFHPDGMACMGEERRKEAEEAFRRVRAAYERLTGGGA